MRWLTSMAWRNLLRHRRRSLLTAMAMAIAVAAVSAIMVLMAGMYGQMREVILDQTLGHVQLHHPDYPGRRQMYDALDDVDSLLTALDAEASITLAAPRLYGQALAASSTRTEGAQLLGIDPVREGALRDLGDRVVSGSWLAEAPEEGVVLGHELARRLEIGVGDDLVLVTQAADGSLGNALYAVVGLLRTGVPTLDRGAAFLHRHDLGVLLALDDRAHEIVVLGEDNGHDATRRALDAAREVAQQPVSLRPWWEVDPTAEQLFAMQGFTSWILIAFFFGVSAVGVVNTLLMSVLERTRELGVMRSLGMRPAEVVFLILSEALLLGALAIGAGLVLAVGLDAYLVYQGVDMTVQGEGYEVGAMTFDPIIKGRWTAAAFWQPAVGVLVFTVLAAVWPAVRAARLDPIDALHDA